jgi:hypothetical protein
LADFFDFFETAAIELGDLGELPGAATLVGERAEAYLKVAIDRRMAQLTGCLTTPIRRLIRDYFA